MTPVYAYVYISMFNHIMICKILGYVTAVASWILFLFLRK